jgi:hypothetical protein
MAILQLILLLCAAFCFGLAAFGSNLKINVMALGLLFWVIVPLLQHIQRV